MIYLLFTVSFAEMMIILLLLFKTPLREPLVFRLDELKHQKAQLVVKSVGATAFVGMMYNIYRVLEIRSNSVDAVDSPIRVIIAYHLLEAFLIGISLFLLLTINSLHLYNKEHIMLTETIRAARKQNQAYENTMIQTADLAKSIKEKISRLRTETTKLEMECDRKGKHIESKTTNSSAIKNRTEGLLVEYDYLLAENKDLKDQLQDINQRLSQSKKSLFFSWDQWRL